MARIRTIKPDFWKDEDLSQLPPETHMLAAALLNYSDDEGYFRANPKLVQAECCPLRDDSTKVRRSLELLDKDGYIRLFTGTDGKEYGKVVTFLDHQRVDRAKPSTIKKLDVIDDESTSNRRNIDDESSEEGKGMEGNGGEGNTRKRALPKNFQLDDAGTAYATERGLDIPAELEKFRDYHKAKGTTMADWSAGWRTWCRNAVKFRDQDKPRGGLGNLE